MIGIKLNTEFDLQIIVKKDAEGKIVSGLVVGDTTDQEAVLVLGMKQGDLKTDPLLGPGLTKFTRGKFNRSEALGRIRLHFIRARIDFDKYKEQIDFYVNQKLK
jgi:hypothetical protein